MKQSLFERCGGEANVHPVSEWPFRVVEAQHLSATRKLVDTAEEQSVLEELIEQAKPPIRSDAHGLHVLLATPFRYPPLPYGSRFGNREEPGIWYGSRNRKTALAETAYYRLLFLEGTRAELIGVAFELSLFRAGVRTRRGVDLTARAFAAHRRVLTSRVDYRATQLLGASLRKARVDVVLYESARDPDRGLNVAVFAPSAFERKTPEPPETWIMTAARESVEIVKKSFFERERIVFPRAVFLVGNRLPRPTVKG